MKPGCFIKLIVILTILVASVLYILEFKLEDWIKEPGKEIITGILTDKWKSEIDNVKDSPEKDSLLSVIDTLDSLFRHKDFQYLNDAENLINIIESSMKDSLITSEEIEYITFLFKNRNQNERSEEN
ncbi:MAG: hypothetical protein Kow0098_20980 [Ignavibacteriaceae bacterium]